MKINFINKIKKYNDLERQLLGANQKLKKKNEKINSLKKNIEGLITISQINVSLNSEDYIRALSVLEDKTFLERETKKSYYAKIALGLTEKYKIGEDNSQYNDSVITQVKNAIAYCKEKSGFLQDENPQEK